MYFPVQLAKFDLINLNGLFLKHYLHLIIRCFAYSASEIYKKSFSSVIN